MTEFANIERLFLNTKVKASEHQQKLSVEPNFLTPLKLGQDIPHPKTDQFNSLYGKPLDIHPEPPYWHPTYKHQNVYPIPYLLNETNDRLIDVVGVYYRNKDLPIMSTRM
jgi:hypothetical protein